MTRGRPEQPQQNIPGTRKPWPSLVKGFTVTEIVLIALAVLITTRIFGRLI